MKNKGEAWGGTLLLLCLLVAFASWIAGIYIDEVHGLLTAAGIRWMVINAMPNFADAPLAKIIAALIAIGGIRGAFHSSHRSQRLRRWAASWAACWAVARWSFPPLSIKQRRALQITAIAAVLYIAAIVVLTIGPGHMLLSAFGTVDGSPLLRGWYGIACLLLLIISSVHGYTSGRFATLADWTRAHTALLAKAAPYFITLFLATQLVAMLDYSDLLVLTGHEPHLLAILRPVLYYLPLAAVIARR